jgi:hypothetical protein
VLGVDFQQGFSATARGSNTPDAASAVTTFGEAADACASQPLDGFSAQDANAFSLARFRYQFGQTMTTEQFKDLVAAPGSEHDRQ